MTAEIVPTVPFAFQGNEVRVLDVGREPGAALAA